MNVAEMKKAACEAIDNYADKLIALQESIFNEPELGYKEFKTAAKIKAALDELGYEYTDGHAVTGIITPSRAVIIRSICNYGRAGCRYCCRTPQG